MEEREGERAGAGDGERDRRDCLLPGGVAVGVWAEARAGESGGVGRGRAASCGEGGSGAGRGRGSRRGAAAGRPGYPGAAPAVGCCPDDGDAVGGGWGGAGPGARAAADTRRPGPAAAARAGGGEDGFRRPGDAYLLAVWADRQAGSADTGGGHGHCR